MSHGTICAEIIKQNYGYFACSSLKILNGTWKCNIQALLAALDWCIEHDVDIVNMSLGSTDFRDEQPLLLKVNELARKTIMVSAQSNDYLRSYPACFTNVICVNNLVSSNSELILRKADIDGVDVSAKSIHYLIPRFGHAFYTDDTNSYAAPFVTAKICKHLAQTRKKDFYLEKISGCSLGHFYRRYPKPDWVHKAIVISNSDIPANFPFKVFSWRMNDFYSYSLNNEQLYSADSLIILLDSSCVTKQDIYKLMYVATKYELDIVMKDEIISKYINGIDATKCRVWTPANTTTDAYFAQTNAEIPIVEIYHKDFITLIRVILELRNIFSINGYNAICIFENPLASIFGLWYVPMSMSAVNFFYNIAHYSSGDIIIFAKDGDESQTKNALIDLYLPLSEHNNATEVYNLIVKSFGEA